MSVSALTRTPLTALRLSEQNPRHIERERLEALKRSLATDPEMLEARPVVALPDGTVVCGNMRVRAAGELGWDEIATVTADLGPEQARLWMLRDNNAYGEWEEDALSELLAELERGGSDLALTGFPDDALEALLERAHPSPVDPDEAPALEDQAEPESRPGEIYELGPHRLMCGDATDREQVARLVAGARVDVIVTDPPYGVSYQGGAQEFSARTGKRKVRTVAGDGDARLYAATLPLMHELLRPDGALYLWFSDSRASEVLAAVADSGFRQRAVLIWAKDVPTGSLTAQYIPRHEPLLYASPGSRAPRFFGPTNEVTLWEHPKPRVNDLHPTQKPVALLERAIRNSSRRGETVLDLFAGSGSTLIASELTGRRCFAMELDPRYCDVIRRRYEAFAGG